MTISRDGRFVYSSSRGENTLIVHAVEPRSGWLTDAGISVPVTNPGCLTFVAG